jgi:hypothetical protein
MSRIVTKQNFPTKDKRIFWIAPDFSNYFECIKSMPQKQNPFLMQISKSVSGMASGPYKYLIAYVPGLHTMANWTDSNDLLMTIESAFQREVVLLESIEQIKEPDFAPYLRNDCIYLCKDIEQTVYLHTYFDVVIQDSMSLPLEIADADFKDKLIYGQTYLEALVIHNIFLSKVAERIQNKGYLGQSEIDADICLVVGSLPAAYEDTFSDLLSDLLRDDKVACLIVCNDQTNSDYDAILTRFDSDTRFIMFYSTDSNKVTQRSSNVIWRKLSSVNKATTSFVFLGSFIFDELSVQEYWIKNMANYLAFSIMEPWAWMSMNAQVMPAQTSLQIINVLKMWHEHPPIIREENLEDEDEDVS